MQRKTPTRAKRRHRRLIGSAIGVLVLSLAVGTALAARGPAGKAAGKTTFTFISFAKSLDNPAFAVAEKGAKVRISEVKKSGITIKLKWLAPANGDATQMVSMIDSAIATHPDGLLVDSLGPAVCTAVNDAVKAHIPVVMWDSDCPGSKRSAYVGSDNYKGGIEAAKLFSEAWKGKTSVPNLAILITTPGAFNIGQRADGFIKGLKNIHQKYKLVVQPQGDDDIAKSVDAVETTLQGNQSIDAFYFAQPLPLLAAGKQLPNLTGRVKSGKLTVVAFDTIEPELKWVADGTVYGLVGQRYYDWGYEGITVLLNIAKYGSKYPPFVDTGLDIVTKKGGPGRWTPAQFEVKWKKFSFSDKPIKPTSGKFVP
jgi:ribose transport system substrate-binding protein